MACNCQKKRIDEDYNIVKEKAIKFVEAYEDCYIYKEDSWWIVKSFKCVPSSATNVEYVHRLLFVPDNELH